MRPGNRQGERLRGLGLVAVLMVASILFLLVGSVGLRLSQSLGNVARHDAGLKARYAAQGGLQDALLALRKDSAWSDGFQDKPMPGDADLRYTVTVINNTDGSLGDPHFQGELEVPAGAVHLAATGTAGEDHQARVSALAFRDGPTFDHALQTEGTIAFSSAPGAPASAGSPGGGSPVMVAQSPDGSQLVDPGDPSGTVTQGPGTPPPPAPGGMVVATGNDTSSASITIGPDGTMQVIADSGGGQPAPPTGGSAPEGSTVDGYDSRLGDYSPSSAVSGESSVRTNASGPGAVSLGSGCRIDGDVVVGPGADPVTAVVGPASSYLAVQVAEERAGITSYRSSYPESSESPAALDGVEPGSYGAVQVGSGSRMVLRSGEYRFDSLDVAGRIEIDAGTGPVLVYVGGALRLRPGADVNSGGKPSQLQVYLEEGVERADLEGRATMVVAAGQAVVNLGGDYRGAVLGRSATVLPGGEVHYDVALRGVPMGRWKLGSHRR